MNAPSSVTAEQLIRALKKRRAALPAEIGSFMVLEACEALLASTPRLLTTEALEIGEDGSVRLGSAPASAEQEASLALHRLLTSVLVAAGPAPHPALMRLVERGPSSGQWTLSGLRDDLEASLVPLNRQASRRVLSRLVREVGWAERAAPRPSFHDLDSELSSLLDSTADAEVPVARPQPMRAPLLAYEPDLTRPDSVDELDDDESTNQVQFFDSVRPVAREPTGRTVLDVAPNFARGASSPELRRAPSERPEPRLRAPSDFPAASKRSSSAVLAGFSLVALSALVMGLTLYLRPELLARFTDREPPLEQPIKLEPPPAQAVARGGDLVVRVAPERSQVLRFVGRGPVTVPHLPIGVAHEFVAMAEGYSPIRLLVPKDAEWDSTPDGKRYEAAMQLGSGQTGPQDLGDTLLPQDVGVPSDALGSVRIVTTPKGAKVYQVIGFAPEARIQDLPLDATQEIFLFKRGHTSEVRVVAPSDYVDSEGRKRAVVDVTLNPLPKTRGH